MRGLGDGLRLRNWRAYIVLSCTTIFFWSISLRAVFYSLAPLMALDFGWNETVSGAAVGIFLGAYSLGQWISGVSAGEPRRTVLAGIVLALASGLFVVLYPRPFSLLAIAPWLSFGLGVYFPKGVYLLTTAAPAGAVGRYLSYHEIAASLALVAGPFYVGWFSRFLPWHLAFFFWCLLGLLPLWLFWRLRFRDKDQAKLQADGRFVYDKFFFYSAVLGSCMLTLAMGLTSVLPLALVKFWQESPEEAAYILGLTRIGSTVTPMLFAWSSDRFGQLIVLCLNLVLCAAVLLGLSFTPSGLLFEFLLALLALAISGIPAVFFSFLADNYARASGTAAGMIGGLANLVGAGAAPVLFGYLIERFAAWVVFDAAALVAFVGLVMLSLAARSSVRRRTASSYCGLP